MYKFARVTIALILVLCGCHRVPERFEAGTDGGAVPLFDWSAPGRDLKGLERALKRERAQAADAQDAAIQAERRQIANAPPHKGVPPHPLVVRCMKEQEHSDWEHLKGCLTAAAHDIAPLDAGVTDGGRRLKGSVPFPPVANPSWLLPEWDFDPASRLATCSDDNTCVSSASPCCTYQQVVSRWSTDTPSWRQNTTVLQHSSQAVNPPVDQFRFTPRVQAGAIVGFQADFVAGCSGTLSGVQQLSRGYPDVPLAATLCAGLTQPTLVRDTTAGGCDVWIDTNTSGNTWTLTHYLGNGATFIPPSGGSDQLCSLTNGDSFQTYIPVTSNMRYFDPYWEDLADSPDSRPTLYGGQYCVGVNSGAGSDTAQCAFFVNGAAINEAAFSSSTMIAQTRFTHGSRAFGYLQNVFFSDNSARTTVSATAASVPDLGAGGQPTKLIEINGGRLVAPILNNVFLTGDVRVVNAGGGGSFGSGAIVYGSAYVPNIGFRQASVTPANTTSVLYGSGGTIQANDLTKIVCNSPAATYCPIAGLQLDGAFDGYAYDDSTAQARTWVHVPNLFNTMFSALDTSISGGGCGGHCIGRGGSEASLYNAVPGSPPPLYVAGTGITLTGCNTPGQQCTVTNTVSAAVCPTNELFYGTGTGFTCSTTGGNDIVGTDVNGVPGTRIFSGDLTISANITNAIPFKVVGLQSIPVSSTAPTAGQVLGDVAGVWTPVAPTPTFACSNLTSCTGGQLPATGVSPGGNATALFSDGTGCPGGSPCTTEWDTISGDVTFDHFTAGSPGGAFYHVVGLGGIPYSVTGSLTNGDELTYSSTGPKWTNHHQPQWGEQNNSGNITTTLTTIATTSVTVGTGQTARIWGNAWVTSTDTNVHTVNMSINSSKHGQFEVGNIGTVTVQTTGSIMTTDTTVGTNTYNFQLALGEALGAGGVTCTECIIRVNVTGP